jgi:hypothetical protein
MLIEQALKFGAECHGIDLRPTLAPLSRRFIREHLEQDDVPQTKEEVFFALAVAVVGIVDVETRGALRNDLMFHNSLGFVSDDVMLHFMSEAVKYTGDDEEDGRAWVTDAVAHAHSVKD